MGTVANSVLDIASNVKDVEDALDRARLDLAAAQAQQSTTAGALSAAQSVITEQASQITGQASEIARLNVRITELEALLAGGEDPDPEPDPDYPGWVLHRRYDMSANTDGWSSTSGQTNSGGVNRQQQITHGPDGMTITGERASATSTIYIADARAMSHPVPNYFRVKARIKVDGYGPGVWPALWLRPLNGQGEIDIWEMFGISHEAFTMHVTPYDDATHEHVGTRFLPKREDVEEWRTYEFEKVEDTVRLWINGELVGTMTKAIFDQRTGTAGDWDSMFEKPAQTWYMRFTMQAGTKSGGPTSHGSLLSTWRKSSVTMSELAVYRQAA